MTAENKLDCLSIIRRSPWFQGLPDSALHELADACRIKRHPNKSYLYNLGELTNDVYCLVDGIVRITITSSLGQEFTVVDMEPETWLGEASLLGDLPRILSAEIKSDTTLLHLPRQAIERVGEAHPILYKNLFKDNLTRSRQMYELLGSMLFFPLHSRLAGRVLHLLEDHAEEADGGVYLNVKLSQSDFARLTLGSRQRVNKIFRRWNDQGIMVMKSNRYFIPSIEALQDEFELKEE